jgi:hypothetical protein
VNYEPVPSRCSAPAYPCRFHDAVLAHGSVPLPVLEQQMDAFIKGESAR